MIDRDELARRIRTVADFPKPGIAFRDITTLLADAEAFAASVAMLGDLAEDAGAQKIAGIDARGFVFGGAVAARLGLGLVPVRKAGKLPVATHRAEYALEYGNDTLELDASLIVAGERVVLIDDLIATGGTAIAALELLARAGSEVPAALFVIDLPDLGGLAKVRDLAPASEALIAFAGE